MDCAEIESLVDPYLDEEFEPAECIEFEKHLLQCVSCADKVRAESTYRKGLKLAVSHAAIVAPESLRRKVKVTLRQEHRLQNLAQWSRLGIAAGTLFAVGAATYWAVKPYSRQRYIDDAAVHHARQFPLEVRDSAPGPIEAWFGGKLNHPVRIPRLQQAVPLGGRLLNVQEKQAAYIRYDAAAGPHLNSGNVGVFVFEDLGRDFEVGDAPDWVTSHGFNVLSWRSGDVVYQLVTDLAAEDISQMMQQAPRETGVPQITPPIVPAVPAGFQR